MEQFGKFCLGVIIMILSALIGGWVFMKLWEWFIVYAFNAHKLDLIQSIGVSFFIGYLKWKKDDKESEGIEKVAMKFLQTLIYMAVFFGLAWIITLFQ